MVEEVISTIHLSYGVWGVGVYAPCGGGYTTLVILVSAFGPNFRLGLGPGPGLDNKQTSIDI